MCKPSWIHPRRTDMNLHLHKHKPEDTPKVFLAPHVEGKFMYSSQVQCELRAGSTCLLCKSSASWGSPACEIKHSENSYSESLHGSSYQGKFILRKSENPTLLHWRKKNQYEAFGTRICIFLYERPQIFLCPNEGSSFNIT